MHRKAKLLTAALLLFTAALPTLAQATDPQVPQIGTQFPDFTLSSIDGASITLKSELKKGPVVVVVLRGWPGYQCPFCSRQFADFLTHAADFAKTNTTVLFIYPGPASGLKEHAEAFNRDKPMPANFRLLLDPDLRWLESNKLRWQGKGETSYPATFVIDRRGELRFSAITKAHGGRVMSAAALSVLAEVARK